MMTRSLAKRLERLEAELKPSDEPVLTVTVTCVGVRVTLTVVCATRSGCFVDCATSWIANVPLCRPGAGLTVTLPVLSMVTVQPGGAWAVRL